MRPQRPVGRADRPRPRRRPPARARVERLIEWVLPVAEEIGAAAWLRLPAQNAAERQIEAVPRARASRRSTRSRSGLAYGRRRAGLSEADDGCSAANAALLHNPRADATIRRLFVRLDSEDGWTSSLTTPSVRARLLRRRDPLRPVPDLVAAEAAGRQRADAGDLARRPGGRRRVPHASNTRRSRWSRSCRSSRSASTTSSGGARRSGSSSARCSRPPPGSSA